MKLFMKVLVIAGVLASVLGAYGIVMANPPNDTNGTSQCPPFYDAGFAPDSNTLQYFDGGVEGEMSLIVVYLTGPWVDGGPTWDGGQAGMEGGAAGDIATLFDTNTPNAGVLQSRWWEVVSQYFGEDLENPGYWVSPNFDPSYGSPAPILTYIYDSDFIGTEICPDNSAATCFRQGWAQQEADTMYNKADAGGIANTIKPESEIVFLLPPGLNGRSTTEPAYHDLSENGHYYTVWGNPATASVGGDMAFTKNAQHELFESMTNPFGPWEQYGWCAGELGMNTCNGCEISDMCQNEFFQMYAQSFAKSNFPPQIWQQLEFSNEALTQAYEPNTIECVYARAENAAAFGISGGGLYGVMFGVGNYNAPGNLGTSIGWGTGQYWGNNGTSIIGRPGASSWGPGRYDVFALSSTGAMEHAWVDNDYEFATTPTWDSSFGAPSGYTFATANNMSSPDAVSWGPGDVQVYAIGFDVAYNAYLFRKANDYGDPWTGWENLGALPHPPSSWISVTSSNATTATSWNNANGFYMFPQETQTVVAAYVDNSQNINFGYLTGVSASMTWVAQLKPSSFSPSFYPENVDIAQAAPGYYDVFAQDSDERLWDCQLMPAELEDGGSTLATAVNALENEPTPHCWAWGYPDGGTPGFSGGAGATGLGDGRIFVVAPSNMGGCSNAMTADDAIWNAGYGWVNKLASYPYSCNGGYNGVGFDVVSAE